MDENRFLILMYHMISKPLNDSEKKYACPPDLFDRHMRFIHEKYDTITLNEIADHHRQCQPLAKNSVAITLDDGFADNFEYGYPILQKYNIPATIFLTTGLLGNRNIWMSSDGFPERKLLSWDQIKKMQGLIHFGAHTVNHVRLPEIDLDMARQEIHKSKTAIEDSLGTEVKHFAYPYGLFNLQVERLVKGAGFESACTTRSGFNNINTDLFNLRRIEIFGNDPLWKVKQKLQFGTNDAKLLFPVQYYSSRIMVKLGLR